MRARRVIPLVCVALAGIGAWYFYSRHGTPASPPSLLPPPMAVMAVADGSRIELLQVTCGGISHSLPKSTSAVHVTSGTTSSFGLRGTPQVSLETDSSQPGPQSIKFETQFPDPIAIEFRWLGKDGMPQRPLMVYDGGYVSTLDFNHGSGAMTPFSGSPDTITGKVKAGIPDMLVQYDDGSGGWLCAEGPVGRDDDPNRICVAHIPVWNRSCSSLKIRFIVRGLPPVEFTGPCPTSAGISPITATPVSLPATVMTPEGPVVLESVESFSVRETCPVLVPTMHFDSRRNHNFHEVNWTTAEDETGNRTNFDGAPTASGHEFGCQFPTGSHRIRLRGRIRENDSCPIPRADCTVVASGVVAPDGTITTTVTPSASSSGIKSVSCELLDQKSLAHILNLGGLGNDPNKFPGDSAILVHGLALHVEGVSDRSAPITTGNPSAWKIEVIPDSENESCGISSLQGSSFDNGTSPRVAFNIHYHWAGRLSPGQKVEIAITGPRPPIDFDFVVERP